MNDGISIVIPVHNGERYIGEAVESLLAQTLPPSEIVVVADNHDASDRSGEIAAGYPTVRLLHTEHLGAGHARNVGVDAARFATVGFLDADDIATPRRLELQRPLLADADAVVGRMEMFFSEDCDPGRRERVRPTPGTPMAYLTSTLLIRRAAFLDTGGMQPLLAAEVVEWFWRARARLRFAELDGVVVRRRIHAANNSLARAEHFRRELIGVVQAAAQSRRATP